MAFKREKKSGYPVVQGGIEKKTNPYVGNMGLLDIEGFHLDEAGALSKWQGFAQHQAVPSVFAHAGELTPDVTGLFNFVKSDGTAFEIATTKTKVWRFGTPTTVDYNELALASAGGNRTATVDDITDFTVLKDRLYMVNGIDGNIKYDGTNIYNMGISAPSTAPTIASGGAGVLTGAYSYKVTFYNSVHFVESNPSVASNTFTASANQINLTAIPTSSDAQVDRRRIYRTTTGGGIWLFVAEIANNTATIFTDNLADSTLGIGVELLANGVPPMAKISEVYKGHVFMVPKDSSRINFSDQNKPDSFHVNDFRDLDPDDGDNIRGIKRLFGQIIAFKDESIWNGNGNDRFSFGFNRQVTGVGAVNNESIMTVPGRNVFMFMSENGFYSYDGVSERYESAEIEPIIKGLNQAKLRQIHGIVYKKKNIMVWFAPNGASTQNNLMIIYDYVQKMWTTRSLTNTKMPANVSTIIEDGSGNDEFFIGGYTTGEVYRGDSGLSDNGAAITCSVTDRALPRPDNKPDEQKSFYRIVLFFKPIAGASCTASYAINDPDGSFISLGTILLSDASGQASLRFSANARRIYFKFNASAIQNIAIRGWTAHYKVLGRVA